MLEMRTEVKPFAFFIPELPRRCLSTNASGEERNRWTVSAAKVALGLQTETALLPDHDPLPFFPFVRVHVTAHIAVHKRPKIEDCPRCWPDWLEERWAGKKNKKTGSIDPPGCRCYRPTDPPNLGGDVTKPITDTLSKLKVITDDTFQYVDAVVYRIEKEETVAEEGLWIVVEPLEPTETVEK